MIHGGNVWRGQHPASWLDFSANLRPEGPPEWVMDVIRQSIQDTRYYPDPEMRAARTGLAAFLGLPVTHVLPTAGGAAAIDLVLGRQDGTVFVNPITFGEYAERARIHGRPVTTIPVPGTALPVHPGDTVILCNPNNPTGKVLPADRMLDLNRSISASGGEFIVDEAFIDFCPENSVRQSVSDSLTIIGSLTKLLGIPGIRLGYIAGTPEMVSSLSARQLPWSLNTMAAAIAAALPDHVEDIQADIRLNAQRRDRFASALRSLGAEVSASAANFLLVRFPRSMQPAVPLLRSRGILVRDCTSFGLDDRCLRLAVRLDEENECLTEELRTWLKH